MTYNAYGLSREIPAAVKREVRQRDGFGCVICGLGIVQYEHVDPEFKDARSHDPDAIALLCPQCHSKITTRMWSKGRVKLAMRNPKCRQVGFAREFFDFSEGYPPIQVSGHSLFKIKPPELPGEPFLFSGLFTDSRGNVSLEIEDNEWKAYSNLWDVDVQGPTIKIREAQRAVHLVLKIVQPDTIVVEKLKMSLGGLRFQADGNFLRVIFPNGNVSEFTSCIGDNCMVGMSF